MTIFQSDRRELHDKELLPGKLPTNRNALPGTPPRTEMLYLGRPHEQKCFTWDSPRTEMLYLERPHEQKCFTREKKYKKLRVKYKTWSKKYKNSEENIKPGFGQKIRVLGHGQKSLVLDLPENQPGTPPRTDLEPECKKPR